MRVSKWIERPSDVYAFIHSVAKYNKKRYTIKYNSEFDRIQIVAVAISRDLTDIIKWRIMAYLDEEMEKAYSDRPYDMHGKHLDVTPYALLPIDEKEKEVLYPHANLGNYEDVFLCNGFIKVDQIYDKDGREIRA